MCIKVIRQAGHIEIWVSNNVSESELDQCIERCRQCGMPIVVYRSGRGDIADLTSMLLRNNVDRRIHDKNAKNKVL